MRFTSFYVTEKGRHLISPVDKRGQLPIVREYVTVVTYFKRLVNKRRILKKKNLCCSNARYDYTLYAP